MEVEFGSFLGQVGVDVTKVVLASTAAAAAAIWWGSSDNDITQLPPGPRGYPILGNSLQFNKAMSNNKLPQYTLSMHEKYGKLISFKVGAVLFVCINDGELMRTLFGSNDFSERPVESMPILKKIYGGDAGGICFNNGANHAEMRRLALATFRDLGVGKRSLDEIVHIECEHFSRYLAGAAQQRDGVLFDLKPKAQQVTGNVIHHIMFGTRFDFGDEKWIKILEQMNALWSVNIFGLPENFIPILKYVPFLSQLLTRKQMAVMYDAGDFVRAYVKEMIEDHRSTYIPGEIRDFVDLFIKNEIDTSTPMNMENLFLVIVDIFRAGIDSTANTLTWSIQHMTMHPDVQEEIRTEIDEVVGSQTFKREDKHLLVKTVAFVYEVMRYTSIAPSTGPHTCRKPIKVGDYIIPANSVVFGSLYSMHHDKDYWGDPEVFRISRWIDERGELIKHKDHFFPYASGKRICIGNKLASIEVLSFIVHILQRFKFEKAPGYEDMSNDQKPGFLRAPNSFHVKVINRE